MGSFGRRSLLLKIKTFPLTKYYSSEFFYVRFQYIFTRWEGLVLESHKKQCGGVYIFYFKAQEVKVKSNAFNHFIHIVSTVPSIEKYFL